MRQYIVLFCRLRRASRSSVPDLCLARDFAKCFALRSSGVMAVGRSPILGPCLPIMMSTRIRIFFQTASVIALG